MVIKCFGIARDIFEKSEIEINNSEIKSVADLRKYLNSKNEKLKSINSYFIAINQEYADEDQVIITTDELAIIPPVSGG